MANCLVVCTNAAILLIGLTGIHFNHFFIETRRLSYPWIPLTKSQYLGKCFQIVATSWLGPIFVGHSFYTGKFQSNISYMIESGRKNKICYGKRNLKEKYIAVLWLKFLLQRSTVKHTVKPPPYALLVCSSKAWIPIHNNTTLSNKCCTSLAFYSYGKQECLNAAKESRSWVLYIDNT